jgi:hypothetical protein
MKSQPMQRIPVTSVSDLDPDLIRIQSVSGSGSRGAKVTHKNRKKLRNFRVLKCSMFSFEG